MGLKLRYQLFHDVSTENVLGAYSSFYVARQRRLLDAGSERQAITFHCEQNGWVSVDLDAGWEWKERREVQLFVSQALGCAGFLVYVYDGLYWGYEFFAGGELLDHFVQVADDAPIGFPEFDCRGSASVVAGFLPNVPVEAIEPYLVRKTSYGNPTSLNVPPRPGDQYTRFHSCAVLNFLRMLRIGVGVEDSSVRLHAPVFRQLFHVESRE